MDESATTEAPEQVRVRRDKRQPILDAGGDPYPVGVPITHTIAQVRRVYADELAPGAETEDGVGASGRVVHLRNTGKLCCVTVQDGSGHTLQYMISQREVGQDSLAAFKSDVDLGDHLFARRRVVASRRGELSVF